MPHFLSLNHLDVFLQYHGNNFTYKRKKKKKMGRSRRMWEEEEEKEERNVRFHPVLTYSLK